MGIRTTRRPEQVKVEKAEKPEPVVELVKEKEKQLSKGKKKGSK